LRTGSRPFDFENFRARIYEPFVEQFIGEIKEAFQQMEFWHKFGIFDPRKLPSSTEELEMYGNEELKPLLLNYGESKEDTFKGKRNTQDPDINILKADDEWLGFKELMFKKKEAHQNKLTIRITSAIHNKKNQEEIKKLQTERESYTPKLLWEELTSDPCANQLYPSMMFLLKMLLLFPVSVACCERLFSKLKLVKTRLRNQLSQIHLDQLLRIGTESPDDDFSDDTYDHFVEELKRKNPKMSMEL
jgi:hypothetical protein